MFVYQSEHKFWIVGEGNYIFAENLMKDETIKMVNKLKNVSDIMAKMNPKVKLEQEASLMKT